MIWYLVTWTQHKTITQKTCAHSGILGNEYADTLANEGTLECPISSIPNIHIAHTVLYKLANDKPHMLN